MGKVSPWPPHLDEVLNACPERFWQEIAWCVGSPSLLAGLADHWGQEQDEAARLAFSTWLQHAASAGLATSDSDITSATQRLGYRFEQCIQAWFNFHPDWIVHTANHVVQIGKRTAGEIDLLIGQDEACIHLELAVKFYLSSAGSSRWDTWLGIDPSDRLDLKVAKFERQLDLTRNPEVEELLGDQGWHITQRRAWMKGWFFEHFSRISQPVLPEKASHLCNVGWWCHAGEWDRIWSKAGGWAVLEPRHWMRVRHQASDVVVLDDGPSLPRSTQKSNAWMVVQLVREGDECREINRGVVVKDGWPEAR